MTTTDNPKAHTSRSTIQGTAKRHIVVIITAAIFVYAFSIVHDQWSPMHRWNRAFGDAALVLLAFTMTLGAAHRLFRPAAKLLPWRRELGIYSVLMACIHTTIIFDGWIEWNFVRLFGFEMHPTDLEYVMLQQGFGLANAIGLLAVGIGLILFLTSSDRAVRLLGAASWKTVQMLAIVLWTLAVVHTAYFLYAHFLSFHRATPVPNPLQIWFAGLVLLVFSLRSVAYVSTVWARTMSQRPTGRSEDA